MDNTGQPVLSVTFNCQNQGTICFEEQYASSRNVSWFELVRDLFKKYVHQTICAFVKNILNLFK